MDLSAEPAPHNSPVGNKPSDAVANASARPHTGYRREDFHHSPLIVFYEVTRACDLVCRHCRASAMPAPSPRQLSPAQTQRLLEALASFPRPPMVILTGGDPMKRPDLLDIIATTTSLGLECAVTPSPTPLMTQQAIRNIAKAGAKGFGVSLDGATPETHDAFRGIRGSYHESITMIQQAGDAGMGVQVNTTVTAANMSELEALADLLRTLPVRMWSVFFLVPVGRARLAQRITARQYERIFELLYRQREQGPYAVKSTEAPHYRRFVMQKLGLSPHDPPDRIYGLTRLAPVGTNDGRGVMFISHTGEICPSGFMPIVCGVFPQDSPVDVYQHHELFTALRDPAKLEGKCGACEYREVCGGSRARAYAVTGNPFAAEPDCVYIPPQWRSMRRTPEESA